MCGVWRDGTGQGAQDGSCLLSLAGSCINRVLEAFPSEVSQNGFGSNGRIKAGEAYLKLDGFVKIAVAFALDGTDNDEASRTLCDKFIAHLIHSDYLWPPHRPVFADMGLGRLINRDELQRVLASTHHGSSTPRQRSAGTNLARTNRWYKYRSPCPVQQRVQFMCILAYKIEGIARESTNWRLSPSARREIYRIIRPSSSPRFSQLASHLLHAGTFHITATANSSTICLGPAFKHSLLLLLVCPLYVISSFALPAHI